MDTRSGLLRYGFVALAWVAGIEWLLGRAVSRLAASPTLDGFPRTIIEWLGSIGLFLLAPATLLAFALLMLAVSGAGSLSLQVRDKWRLALAIYLGLFGVISAYIVFMPRAIWLGITYSLLALVAFWWLALQFAVRQSYPAALRMGGLLISGAYTGYLLYLLLQQIEDLGFSSGLSPIVVRDLGEAALVAVPFAFFAAVSVPHRQWAQLQRWILPLILAVGLSAANIADMLANQGFTGVFAIWSIGLSYYLPWPLYALSLALYVYAILTCLSPDEAKSEYASSGTAIGLILLTLASYEIQFPYQYVLAALSLMLLTRFVVPFASAGAAATHEGPSLQSGPQSQATPPIVTT